MESLWLGMLIYFYYAMYIKFTDEYHEGFPAQYGIFLLEQLITVGVFLLIRMIMACSVINKPVHRTINSKRQYSILRCFVYAIEIVLMIWVQEAADFYSLTWRVNDVNWFLKAIAIGLWL